MFFCFQVLEYFRVNQCVPWEGVAWIGGMDGVDLDRTGRELQNSPRNKAKGQECVTELLPGETWSVGTRGHRHREADKQINMEAVGVRVSKDVGGEKGRWMAQRIIEFSKVYQGFVHVCKEVMEQRLMALSPPLSTMHALDT